MTRAHERVEVIFNMGKTVSYSIFENFKYGYFLFFPIQEKYGFYKGWMKFFAGEKKTLKSMLDIFRKCIKTDKNK